MASKPPVKSSPVTLANSSAFRQATVRSEVQRAYAVLALVGLIVIVMYMPGSSIKSLDYRVRMAALIGMGVLFMTQVGVLALARWARHQDRMIPTWFIVATVIIESLVPTGIIMSNILMFSIYPYISLSTPPIFAYGLMICLTTLRLRPALCVLAGAVCATGYAGTYLYVAWGLGVAPPSPGLPRVAYVNSVILIFISGLAAAWVAREIRRHMEAALGEAETRRRVERMEDDLSVARTIQRALLPRTAPIIPGYDIAGWNRPADQTGGDYYDWQALSDGNWIITLADVSGHGIGPALVTAACRAYVRASDARHRDLASLTARINSLLADDLPEGRFVTMVSVLIDANGGPLALLSAGHGPIVLYASGTGEVRDILPQSMPLAVLPDTDFGPVQPVELAKGDVLALVTDGFVEWHRENGTASGEQFGLSRLRESLRRHAHLSASAMIESITADVSAFTQPTPQQDDLTMVVIRRVQ